MPNPCSPASNIILCTTRLVDVPIKVQSPPNIVTYDNGIKKYVAGNFTMLAHRFMIGAKITTTGVLFRKAGMNAMTGNIRACAFSTVVFFCGSNFLITCDNAPLWRTPSLTKNSIATVIIPLLLKPSSISFGERMPVHKNITTAENRIIPGRILSAIRAMSIPISTTRTIVISTLIAVRLFRNEPWV